MKFTIVLINVFISTLLLQAAIHHVSFAQQLETTNNRRILILNKKHETVKELMVGDKIRLLLKNGIRIKGYIASVDSTYFTVDSQIVHPDQVEKVSIKKTWVQVVGTPFLAFGGFLTFAALATGDIGDDGYAQAALIAGIPITAIGLGLVLPGYYEIGKRFIIIAHEPDAVKSP